MHEMILSSIQKVSNACAAFLPHLKEGDSCGDTVDDAVAFGMELEGVFLCPSSPCFELFLLQHFTPRRKPFEPERKMVGEPVRTERIENSIIVETVVTRYKPDTLAAACRKELGKFWKGNPKKMADPSKLMERAAQAIAQGFPAQEKQTSLEEVWTLWPELLVRLLATKYSAKDIGRLLGKAG